jgi:N-acetylneuraminic acid mutarotase
MWLCLSFIYIHGILWIYCQENISHPISVSTMTWIKGSSQVNPEGVYGAIGIESSSNTPGGREGSVSWTSSSGHACLFAGGKPNGSPSEYFNDVWCYNIQSLSWVWLKGSSQENQLGVYGPIGEESSSNTPGGRIESVLWSNSRGDVWIFGGSGYGNSLTIGYLNDVWYLDMSTLTWIWLKGSSEINQVGTYGSLGEESASNTPGGRKSSLGWSNDDHMAFLFGGSGYNLGTPLIGVFNDIWSLNTDSMLWVWLKGSSLGSQEGTYGTLGVESILNYPGGREGSALWKDTTGNIYIFGGTGYGSSNGYLNVVFECLYIPLEMVERLICCKPKCNI